MTLADIMKQAMLQLGEDPADISEFDELFHAYANMGYMIAIDQYAKPREARIMKADKRGIARMEGCDVARIAEAWTLPQEGGKQPRMVSYTMMADGKAVITDAPDTCIVAICEIHLPEMEEGTDEPRLPPFAQAALADFICYRHLSTGNAAKQRRANFFRNSFYEAMGRLRGDGYGSVKRFKNLYSATDARA